MHYHRHVCLFLMVQVERLVLSACVMCMVLIWGSCAAAVSGGGMGAREGGRGSLCVIDDVCRSSFCCCRAFKYRQVRRRVLV
jgi:hypothetical protein